MRDLDYVLEAAQAYIHKAEKERAAGREGKALQNRQWAADRYREAAQICPERRREFEELARRCVAGRSEALSPPPLSYPPNDPPAARLPHEAKRVKERSDEIPASDYVGYALNIVPPNQKVSFDEIIGLEDAKRAIKQDLIYPLQFPEKFERYNLKVGATTLLYGPPGTGKTTFAKAVASTVSVPFINVRCGDLVNSFIGETGKNIGRLFEDVRRFIREQRTSVVLFMDEFDEIARSRDSDNKTAQEAVPALLAQLDGFETDNSDMIIIAATNFAELIDRAIMDRCRNQILVPLPTKEDRKKIFEFKFKQSNLEDAILNRIDFDEAARKSEGLSGRKIKMVTESFMRQLVMSDIENRGETVDVNALLAELIERERG